MNVLASVKNQQPISNVIHKEIIKLANVTVEEIGDKIQVSTDGKIKIIKQLLCISPIFLFFCNNNNLK